MGGSEAVLESVGAGHCGRLPALSDAGLAHAFSCRDLDPGVGDPGSRERATAGVLLAHLGRPELGPARLRQQHTAVVHRVDTAPLPRPAPVGDALFTDRPGVTLSVGTADCLPVLLVSRDGRAAAAVHAGWRGTAAGVLPVALGRMRDELGVDPASVLVGLGPAIRSCCFEVGPEVEEAFGRRWPAAANWSHPGPRGRAHLDLIAANRDQAIAEGVPPEAFHDTGWCTRCLRDRFFSYRADGPGTGRIVTVAFLAGAGTW